MNPHTEAHLSVQRRTIRALFDLMDMKPFSEITVTEIIERAGIARASYYRNFESKEAVINCYIDGVFQDFKREFPIGSIDERMLATHLSHVMVYVSRYYSDLKILHKANLSSLYLDRLNRYVFEAYGPELSAHEKMKLLSSTGAQYNLIFNLFLEDESVTEADILEHMKTYL